MSRSFENTVRWSWNVAPTTIDALSDCAPHATSYFWMKPSPLWKPPVYALASPPVRRLAGDDVDDAGDRVRAVDRRRAVLEDLDALDHAERDRVEVGGGRDAAARRAVDPAHAVDQHEHALRGQVA